MATGISKGQQTPCSTTLADPRPKTPPNTILSLDVGKSEGISYPLIFMMPSGPMCKSCLRNRRPSLPISEKMLFSIQLTSQQSICKLIFLLPPIPSKHLLYTHQFSYSEWQEIIELKEPLPLVVLQYISDLLRKYYQFYCRMESYNPQATSFSLAAKSFLKGRQASRESGSKFFQDNKVRSCSYVKETPSGLQAISFYDKRGTTQYPTPSTVTRSWSSNTHNNSRLLHAGMGVAKPLLPYHPNVERSLLKIADFRPPYPNTSHIQIGERSQRDTKHYVTTYSNSFLGIKNEQPSSHPGTQASRNQWIHSRLRK